MRRLFTCAVILTVSFFGCGSEDPAFKLYHLNGSVFIDGQPIPTATILLKDPSGQQKTCIATVRDGQIAGESTAGEKSLEITSFRIAKGKTVPGADGTGTEQATEQYLPAKFNSSSTLTASIPATDKQPPLVLELTTK